MLNSRTKSLLTLVAEIVIAALALTAPCAIAQSVVPEVASIPASFQSDMSPRSGDAQISTNSARAVNPTPEVSRTQEASGTQLSSRLSERIMQLMAAQIADVAPIQSESTTWTVVTELTENASAPLLDKKSVIVEAAFETRPVGGILRVTAELRRTFSGVGVSNRPIISESLLEVVDNLSPETLREIISALTTKLVDRGSLLASAKN